METALTRVHVPVQLRWSDLDGYHHVNNATTMRLLEEARIRTFWAPSPLDRAAGAEVSPLAVIEAEDGVETMTIIARQEIEYLEPIPYLRAPLDVQLWLGRIGGASIDICYEIHAPAGYDPAVYARAETTTVLLDAATRRPRRLADHERAAWEPYRDAPLAFRRR